MNQMLVKVLALHLFVGIGLVHSESTTSRRDKRGIGEELKALPTSVYSFGNKFEKVKYFKAGFQGLAVLAKFTDDNSKEIECVVKVAKHTDKAKLAKEVAVLRKMNGATGFPSLLYPPPGNNALAVGSRTHGGNSYDFYGMTRVGYDLSTLLMHDAKDENKDKFLTIDQFIGWIAETFKNVRALHAKGIAHNDLHSGNICISMDSKTVMLIDFDKTTEFDPKAEIQKVRFSQTATGPYVDYERLRLTILGLLTGFFTDDPLLKKKFGDDQKKRVKTMIDTMAALKESPVRNTFKDLAELETDFGNKIEAMLIPKGDSGKDAWFPDWKMPSGPLTSWSKDIIDVTPVDDVDVVKYTTEKMKTIIPPQKPKVIIM